MPTDRSEAVVEGVTALYQTPPPMTMNMQRGGGDESSAAKKSSKKGMHKLIKSAFKRGETSTKDFSDPAAANYGKPPTGQTKTRKNRVSGSDDSGSWDSQSTESFEEWKNNTKVLAALRNAKIGASYESFPWEKKMRELLVPSGCTSFLSILLLPMASDASASKYNSLEDTLARADTWLVSAQASGVPISFVSVQTEALLTKISGDTASATVTMGSLADLANMANVSLYGFEDYHGVDIGVVRAVRLWYSPFAGEMALEIKLLQGDTRLGFAISRTEEGFIYVSSVADENSHSVASTRSGLLQLYKEAKKASKLLIISRVGSEKVLPWMVATTGDIKCFDTVSLSQKLSLHRHALKPILLHLLMWDKITIQIIDHHKDKDMDTTESSLSQHGGGGSGGGGGPTKPPPLPGQSVISLLPVPVPSPAEQDQEEVPRGMSFEGSVRSSVSSSTASATDDDHDPEHDHDGPHLRKTTGPGDSSFRFQNIKLPDSWV